MRVYLCKASHHTIQSSASGARLVCMCRQYPALQGRGKEIAGLTEQSYQAFMARHSNKAVDQRGQTHLQVGSTMFSPRYCQCAEWLLILDGRHVGGVLDAGHQQSAAALRARQPGPALTSLRCYVWSPGLASKVLPPLFCALTLVRSCLLNLQEVLRLIKAQAGAQTAPAVHYLLRFVLLFTSDAFGSSVRRLKALRLDMGRSFSSTITVAERCARSGEHSQLKGLRLLDGPAQ